LEELTTVRGQKLNTVGNIVYHDVPISKDENENGIYSTWG
jgi:seryl-tRNA synthetase